MQNILETEKLLIRPVKTYDAQGIYKYRADKETNKFQGWIPECENDVIEFINKTSEEINTPQTWFQLVIIEKSSNKIVGDLGLHFYDDKNQQVEIGCTLAKSSQGKGYATEAVRIVISYLFSDFNKHRVVASIDPDNLPSIALFERLKFRKEAHFKESLFVNGKWLDDIIYAVLKKEWDLYYLIHKK